MRRNARIRPEVRQWWENKNIILASSIITFTIALIIGVALYSSDNKYNDNFQNEIISITEESEKNEQVESTSNPIGKSIEESNNENNSTNNIENKMNNNSANITNSKTNDEFNANKNTTKKNTINNSKTKNTTSENKKQSAQTTAKVNQPEQVEFEWPVKGEIIRDFSIDNLLFSETLQEWTIHNGIDIKADKSAVVTASADGKVKSIKNDPRYGLTVIIEHNNGYKTVYSNLLTAEFVVEDENITEGQTLGTVGNSANFEVADDSHLHFELLKDGEYIDPELYLK